jgi:hypothetical protein
VVRCPVRSTVHGRQSTAISRSDHVISYDLTGVVYEASISLPHKMAVDRGLSTVDNLTARVPLNARISKRRNFLKPRLNRVLHI